MLVFVHLVSAGLLLACVFADAVFLRSQRSLVVQPPELIHSWRKRVGILEMLLGILTITLGLMQWIPNIQAYPPAIFHSKVTLAVVFVLLVKMRMLIERKKGVQIKLTRMIALIIFLMFVMGALSGKI